MTKLKNYKREEIRKWFCPEPGYVLDFTNRSFAEFFEDHFDINIYADAFSEKGTSKFNRLLSFIELSPPHHVIELLNLLWQRRNGERDDELQQMSHLAARDTFTVDPEYVSLMHDSAAQEDEPFQKLIAEIGYLPSHTAVPHLEKMNAAWSLDTVNREYQRAIDNVEKDPEAAVTAACSMIEGICRSILKARTDELPQKKDIKTLYKEVRDVLGLSPNKDIPENEVEGDVRAILSAISNMIHGIGALRTHVGTAHGRERGFQRLDPRIARLAVNSSNSAALFLIETWEKRFPQDRLMLRETNN